MIIPMEWLGHFPSLRQSAKLGHSNKWQIGHFILASVTFFLWEVGKQGNNNEEENEIYSVICSAEHLQKEGEEAELFKYSCKKVKLVKKI